MTYETLGPYTESGDLRDKDLIQIMGQENLWMSFFARAGIAEPLPPPDVTLDTALGAIEMAAAGSGHTMLLESLTENAMVRDRLTVLDQFALDLADNRTGHYVLLPDRDADVLPGALLLKDWLCDIVAEGRT